ncbi:MAG: glycoside hydrolase family 125 protein, partial [Opitutaceae bacterium]|nr:glycoside hydrolase family 125 protein [Verrucomicrobiales bacterium]
HLIRTEQAMPRDSPYRFQRGCHAGSSLNNHGMGDPVRPCGLVRSSFRPSDDVTKLPYLIPANAMMAVELDRVCELLSSLGDDTSAKEARELSVEIRTALERHAIGHHPVCGEIWAYEIDGFGAQYWMDDANVPSLLSLPYLGFCSKDDPRYRRTRAFCLSENNPYFARGDYASGIGSAHTGQGSIWPMAIVMQALTAVDDAEILSCLRALKATHAGTGFLHEAFDPMNPENFSRKWFAWANTLFGELILTLHRERPHLLAQPL